MMDLTSQYRILQDELTPLDKNFGTEVDELMRLRNDLKHPNPHLTENQFKERVKIMIRKTQKMALLHQEFYTE